MGIYATILILHALVWNSFINAQSTKNCPSSVPRNAYLKTFMGTCYQFVTVEKDWSQAGNYCKQRGGTLVEIRNSGVQNFIVTSLKSLHWKTHGVWIGLSDADVEGTWRWTNGDLVTWTNWDKGEGPNHGFLFSSGGVEDCAHLRLDHNGKWHDAICNGGFIFIKYSYICQYNTANTRTTVKTTARPTTHIPLPPIKQIISSKSPLKSSKRLSMTTRRPASKQTNIRNPTTRQKSVTQYPTRSIPKFTVSNTFRIFFPSPASRPNKPRNLRSNSSPLRQTNPASHSKSDTGLIVGVIIGTVCGMSLIFGLILFVIKKRRINGLTGTSVNNPLYGPQTTS